MSDAVADVIDRAADIIEKVGWCWGSAVGEHGEVCASRALVLSAEMVSPTLRDRTRTVQEAYKAISGVIAEAYPGQHRLFTANASQDLLGPIWIPGWNDAEGRTVTEVLDTLRLAAKKERE